MKLLLKFILAPNLLPTEKEKMRSHKDERTNRAHLESRKTRRQKGKVEL